MRTNNPLSPPGSPGGRKTQGITGLIAGLKDVEERLEQLEGAHDTVENLVTDVNIDMEKLKS